MGFAAWCFFAVENLEGFGIAGSDVLDGDEIVVSGAFPFQTVLRYESVEGGHTAKMVGFGYVDGLMENDCVCDDLIDQLEKRELETVDII